MKNAFHFGRALKQRLINGRCISMVALGRRICTYMYALQSTPRGPRPHAQALIQMKSGPFRGSRPCC